MFLDFYRLNEQPFGVTPDPKYIYFSQTHREALASLSFGVESGCGFMALIAKPGMGKTTLLFRLLDHLQNSTRTIFLFQTQCSSIELLRYILADLGLESGSQDLVEMHQQLNDVLLREAHAGRRVVLAIDEAQNLERSVLETVRLLSDFETPRRKLLQIILSGQPELADKLARPDLAQLRQRITVLCRLNPFPIQETERYVDHRLEVAGYQGRKLFSPDAIELIAKESQGIPRIINTICFNALSIGCALGRYRIDPGIIREVLADLSVNSLIEEVGAARVAASPSPGAPIQTSTPAAREEETKKKGVQAEAPVIASKGVATAPHPGFDLVPAAARMAEAASEHRNGRRQWVIGAGVIAALLIALILHFGFLGARVSGAPTEHENEAATIPKSAASAQGAKPEMAATDAVASPQLKATRTQSKKEKKLAASTADLIAHIVQRNETLSELSVRYLGRFDATFLREIQKLNPDLKDPDEILVGQRVLLPRLPAVQDQRNPSATSPDDSTSQSKEKP